MRIFQFLLGLITFVSLGQALAAYTNDINCTAFLSADPLNLPPTQIKIIKKPLSLSKIYFFDEGFGVKTKVIASLLFDKKQAMITLIDLENPNKLMKKGLSKKRVISFANLINHKNYYLGMINYLNAECSFFLKNHVTPHTLDMKVAR